MPTSTYRIATGFLVSVLGALLLTACSSGKPISADVVATASVGAQYGCLG